MKIASAEHEVALPFQEPSAPETAWTIEVPVSATHLHSCIQESIGRDLEQVNRILDQQLQSPHRFLDNVLQHAGQFRGKQIRPILLLLCQKSMSRKLNRTAHMLAAIVEMIHTATLVHDDILDDASIRRHMPTINRSWNCQTGVLLGDYLFSRAFRLAASTGDATACEYIGRATDLTCAGELHQIAANRDRSPSELDYFRVIRGKTGQLFGLSCHLGARAAQASTSVQQQLRIAGIELGMAFQIVDDILDLTGTEKQTGKDIGNDLSNGRLTLPLLRALQLASASERGRILQLMDAVCIGNSASEFAEYWKQLTSCFAVRQGMEAAQHTAQQLVERSLQRFTALPESEDRRLLEAIAHFAVQREA